MLERFTDGGRRALVLAQEEARLLGHPFLGTEHLLLGLLHEGDGIAAKALDELDITLVLARAKVEELVGRASSAPGGSSSFTPRAKLVMEIALQEALELGSPLIGTEHLLLGLIGEETSVAAAALAGLAVDLDEVRDTVLELLHTHTWESRSRELRLGGFNPPVPARLRPVVCSFCARHTPGTRVVKAGWAVICRHCVEEWHQQLAESDEESGSGPLHESHLVDRPEGRPGQAPEGTTPGVP